MKRPSLDRTVAAAIFALRPAWVRAHEARATGAVNTFGSSLEISAAVPVVALGLWFAVGVWRLQTHRRAASRLRGDLGWLAAGWLTLWFALVSPIHRWGEVLFSAHMVQHELLMIVAAPLFVLGRFEFYLLYALPRRAVVTGRNLSRHRGVARIAHFLEHPVVAWSLHAAALWLWHLPRWFDATLHNDFIHALQHLSFFGTALLFWRAVLHSTHRRVAYGASVLYLFTTAVHSSVLGALLTFAAWPWYPTYATAAQRFGLSPLEDQQLGGLIMWIPAGLIYVGAALALFAAWLRESERRSQAYLQAAISEKAKA